MKLFTVVIVLPASAAIPIDPAATKLPEVRSDCAG